MKIMFLLMYLKGFFNATKNILDKFSKKVDKTYEIRIII